MSLLKYEKYSENWTLGMKSLAIFALSAFMLIYFAVTSVLTNNGFKSEEIFQSETYSGVLGVTDASSVSSKSQSQLTLGVDNSVLGLAVLEILPTVQSTSLNEVSSKVFVDLTVNISDTLKVLDLTCTTGVPCTITSTDKGFRVEVEQLELQDHKGKTPILLISYKLDSYGLLTTDVTNSFVVKFGSEQNELAGQSLEMPVGLKD